MDANAVMQRIDRIERQYDPANDTPGPFAHPMVTWADHTLLGIIIALIDRCDKLERRIAAIEPPEISSCDEYRERRALWAKNHPGGE